MDTNQDRADDAVPDQLAIQPIDPSLWPPKKDPAAAPSALDDADWARLRGGGYPAARLSEQAWSASTDRPALPAVDEARPADPEVGGVRRAGGHRSRRPGPVVVATLGVGLLLAVATLGRSRGRDDAATTATSASSAAAATTGAVATTGPVATTVPAPVASTVPATTGPVSTSPSTGVASTTGSAGTVAGPPVVPPALAGSPAGRELLGGRALPWWGQVVDGRIVVRGRIVSSSAKAAALRNAVARVGADHVIDELVVDASAAVGDGPVPLFVDTPITFDRGSSAVSSAFVTLVGFARYTLFTQPGTRLAVVGASATGEPSAVAIDRAQNVADAVVDNVIDAARVTVVTRPPTPGAADGATDRRVELVFFGAFDPAS